MGMPPMKLEDLLNDGSNLVPEGTYNVKVERAVWMRISKDTRRQAQPQCEIRHNGSVQDAEEHVGRPLYLNYPLVNGKLKYIADLLRATDQSVDFVLETPEQLIGLECSVTVVIKPGTDGFKDKNTITGYIVSAAVVDST